MKEASQREAEKLQYSLRSSFFYRKRKNFQTLIEQVNKIDENRLEWGEPEEIGISKAAWKQVMERGVRPSQLFANPKVLEENLLLVAYYRLIAGLSQKGVMRLAHGTKSYEDGKGKAVKKRIVKITATLNRFISGIIDSDPDFSIESTQLLGAMNYGTQVNGSWRNEIGIEGGRRVKELMLKYFLDEGKINKILLKDGTERPETEMREVEEIQGFYTVNDYKIVFGSEPDVAIINAQGKLEAAIEIKAGIDPAGALERYGAAKKSFDKVLRENKSAETIYLASCITEGVRKAMEDDRLVRRDFNLTNVFMDEGAKEEFLNHIRWLLHL